MNTQHQAQAHRLAIILIALTLGAALLLGLILPAQASGAEVTSGQFHTYAAGPGLGYDISGRAHMTRTADGKTIVSVHATGLHASTAYGVHVHNKACSDSNGGGHYQEIVGGAVDAVNEIWPLFTTNEDGIGNGKAIHHFSARPEAQAVVIHAPGGARIACADLN